MAPRRKSFDDRLRKAVSDSGRSRYSLSKETGISQSAMSRFVSRENNLSMERAELLADELGFDITLTPRKRRR